MASAGGAGGLLAPLSTSERAEIGAPLATAFGDTMIWAVGMSLLALVAAVALLRAERARRLVGKFARAQDGQFRAGSPQTGRA
jgi:putative copper export protein